MKYYRIESTVHAEIFDPAKRTEDYEEWFRPYVSRIHHDGETYRYRDQYGNFTFLYPGDYFVDNAYHTDPYVERKHAFERDYRPSNVKD